MKYFIAEVRDIKDEWESGRVKIRIYGKHDDEQNIKDEHLPWAMPLQPITSAATGRIGISPTGMVVGSRVMGFFLDDAEQYPVIIGTFARAGSQKQKNNNTLGKDDIDIKDSDVPRGAQASDLYTLSTNYFSRTLANPPFDPTNSPKYNNAPHVDKDNGTNAIDEAKTKYAKKGDEATIGSLDKSDSSNVLQKIITVDPNNMSGILTQAPQMFWQIVQIGNMTSIMGVNGLISIGLGGAFEQFASLFGLGSLVGQLLGIFGVVNQFSNFFNNAMYGGKSNFGASGFGLSGGFATYNNAIGTVNYKTVSNTVVVPNQTVITNDANTTYTSLTTYSNTETITTATNTASSTTVVTYEEYKSMLISALVDLLNQLGGYTTPTEEIANLTELNREAFYKALLYLVNKINPDLTVNPYIKIVTSNNVVVNTNATVSQTYIEEVNNNEGYLQVFSYANVYPIQVSSANNTGGYTTINSPTLGTIIIDNKYIVNDEDIPDGYLKTFTYNSTDPIPGYIKWTGFEGQVLYTKRPKEEPYTATPEEDATNIGYNSLYLQLEELIRNNKLSLQQLTDSVNNSRNNVQNRGIDNSLGKNANNNNNLMNILQQLLGLLGTLIQKAQSLHLPFSVLNQNTVNKALQNYSQKAALLRQKKEFAKQAVNQKNPAQSLSSSLLGFNGSMFKSLF